MRIRPSTTRRRVPFLRREEWGLEAVRRSGVTQVSLPDGYGPLPASVEALEQLKDQLLQMPDPLGRLKPWAPASHGRLVSLEGQKFGLFWQGPNDFGYHYVYND